MDIYNKERWSVSSVTVRKGHFYFNYLRQTWRALETAMIFLSCNWKAPPTSCPFMFVHRILMNHIMKSSFSLTLSLHNPITIQRTLLVSSSFAYKGFLQKPFPRVNVVRWKYVAKDDSNDLEDLNGNHTLPLLSHSLLQPALGSSNFLN